MATTPATALPTPSSYIVSLVVGMFNAAPNAAYLQEFSQALTAMGGDYSALAGALGRTPTFTHLYPENMKADAAIDQFLAGLGLKDEPEAQAWMHAQAGTGQTTAQIMVQALAALVQTHDPAFADAQKLLANKAAVADYYATQLKGDSQDFAYLQSVLTKVRADSDLSSPEAIKALIAAGTGAVDPGNPDPGNPDPGNPDPGNPDPGNPQPGVQTIVLATQAGASSSVGHLKQGQQLVISGENQTFATDANSDQSFGTISIQAAQLATLPLTIHNTARANAGLTIQQLVIEDNPQDRNDQSAVRSLQLVSAGQRDTHNHIETVDAQRVSDLKVSGTQSLEMGLLHAANDSGPGAAVSALSVDALAMTGALWLKVDSALANKVDANQSNSFTGGASGADRLEFSAGLQTTAHTKVAGFETVSFHGGQFNATNTSGAQLYTNDGAALQLSHLRAQESVQIGSYDAATQQGVNLGGEQQFVTSQVSPASTLNLSLQSAAAGVQQIDSSGFAHMNITLNTAVGQPAAQKAFALDLSKTAVDGQLNPLQPVQGDYAQASAVPAAHWTRTQLSEIVVTGGSGQGDSLDLGQLPGTVQRLDVSGYKGVVTASMDAPWVSTIGTTQYSTGNTVVKLGAYGVQLSDYDHALGAPSVTSFEFSKDALVNANSAAGANFAWNIEHFAAVNSANAGVGNLSVLDLHALQVHGLADLQIGQMGGDTVVTGTVGQNFKIVLAGVNATELGVENFKFA